MGGNRVERKMIPLSAPTVEVERAGNPADGRADKETQQIGSGASIPDLEGEARANEHRRNQKFRDHFELIFLLLLYALFACFIVLGAVWVLHMVLPEKAATSWRPHGWLSKEQLDNISGLLAGGVIAGLVADHVKRRVG